MSWIWLIFFCKGIFGVSFCQNCDHNIFKVAVNALRCAYVQNTWNMMRLNNYILLSLISQSPKVVVLSDTHFKRSLSVGDKHFEPSHVILIPKWAYLNLLIRNNNIHKMLTGARKLRIDKASLCFLMRRRQSRSLWDWCTMQGFKMFILTS